MNATPCCETVIDYITGEKATNTGAEANRQAVERMLVDEKGYDKADIRVDMPIAVDIGGETYRSFVDLVVSVDGKAIMAVRCAAGSLASWEREIVAAARLLQKVPLALAVVSDGIGAVVWDAVSGKQIGEGFSAIPDRPQAAEIGLRHCPPPLTGERREREKLIFRSYDSMKVNRRQPTGGPSDR